MKMKNIITKILSAVLCGIVLTSCLKNNDGFTDISSGQNAQQGASFSEGDYGLVSRGVLLSTGDVKFSVGVTVAGPEIPTKDVTMTVALDVAALTTYNTEQIKLDPTFVPFILLPAAQYSLPTQVTVKAGSRNANLDVTIKNSTIIFNSATPNSFSIPITITDAQGITIFSNFKTAVVNVVVDNEYAGKYSATGYFNHPVDANDRAIKQDKSLTTVNATDSKMDIADLGSGTSMTIRVNPDKTVSYLTSSGLANPVVSGSLVLAPNTYDSSTKTFNLSYKYLGAGGDRIVNEKLVRK
jgi:hypothetical protein